ncbi:hypothetical protein MMC14_008709 [Varicellaria rhodocarpa]|nr:hypothetical protein [Varicellaria rhodocarpa]
MADHFHLTGCEFQTVPGAPEILDDHKSGIIPRDKIHDEGVFGDKCLGNVQSSINDEPLAAQFECPVEEVNKPSQEPTHLSEAAVQEAAAAAAAAEKKLQDDIARKAQRRFAQFAARDAERHAAQLAARKTREAKLKKEREAAEEEASRVRDARRAESDKRRRQQSQYSSRDWGYGWWERTAPMMEERSKSAKYSPRKDYLLWTAACKSMHETFTFPDPPCYNCRLAQQRRDACLKCTSLKTCQHDLEMMLSKSKDYDTGFLRKLTIAFHPDRFSRWPDEGGVRQRGQDKAKEMFQLLRCLIEKEF